MNLRQFRITSTDQKSIDNLDREFQCFIGLVINHSNTISHVDLTLALCTTTNIDIKRRANLPHATRVIITGIYLIKTFNLNLLNLRCEIVKYCTVKAGLKCSTSHYLLSITNTGVYR